MELENLVSQQKDKVINIAIIILALIIALNIHKTQDKKIGQVKAQKEDEIKKNEILEEILLQEKEIQSFKDIINKKAILSVMNMLGEMARDCGLKITSFRPQLEKEYPVYTRYSFVLEVAADDYHTISKFINKLETSPDIYIIDELKITPLLETEGADTKTKRKAELTFSTILIKD